ncbi:biliverdin-producing heme oxygenase [uncultured Chitinophaga sp.]|uniref:biliverdin-producing heme oxygenase n=1 Tax=uncultured Chitinophaga sp. TaxID=339340 RepID=UPI0025F22D17|nr:biliverdin-producing heme oxygenase [uncultured Chitinophaga sp.]
MSALFSDELKLGTKSEHAQLEKKLVLDIKKINTVAGYTALLKMFYGFYHPIEQQLDAYLAPGLPDFPERRKSAAILQDLEVLGEDTANLPLAGDIPQIDSYAAALGASYVLEGSTLGGSIIAKMISSQLGRQPGKGFSFFSGYGENTMPMWQVFRAQLNKLSGANDQELAVRTAKQTFLKFNQWAGTYEPVL